MQHTLQTMFNRCMYQSGKSVRREKWGFIFLDHRHTPGWQHKKLPPVWLQPIAAAVAYLAFGESKTVVGWDIDMSIIVYFDIFEMCEGLTSAITGLRAVQGYKAIYLTSEPTGPAIWASISSLQHAPLI